jgi:WXXGXW repeat (2 copies)
MNRTGVVIRWLLLAIMILTFSAASFSQVAVGISVRIGPPPLPVYAQPICPGPGYFWTPGYWAWNDDDGYYWVPGTWVVAPVGMLWTPGYWGWGGGFYAWHPGYWGPHIGFYGGINYGFGYTGIGFVGGEWRGRNFYYNRSVTNVSVTNVTNVYNRTVVVNSSRTVSYNGGAGGIQARPTREEERVVHEQHVAPLAMQSQHERLASQNRENFATQNHGRPAIAATSRAGDFSRRAAVPARAAGGEYHAPAISPREARVGARPAGRATSSQGFRPFTPPSKNGGSAGNIPRGNESHSNAIRSNPSRPNDMRPQNGSTIAHPSPQSRESAPRQNSYRPSAPRANAPRPSAPRPSAPPRQQNPPREEHHKGR